MFNPTPKPQKSDKKKRKSIKPISDSSKDDLDMYSYLAAWFKKQHKKCQVCNVKDTQDVHHKKGRKGYADVWAKWTTITLLIDIRFWLPVCRECHIKIENNPEWAKENNYSLNRNTNV